MTFMSEIFERSFVGVFSVRHGFVCLAYLSVSMQQTYISAIKCVRKIDREDETIDLMDAINDSSNKERLLCVWFLL